MRLYDGVNVLNNLFNVSLVCIFIDDVMIPEYGGSNLHLHIAEYLLENTGSHFTEW